MRMRAEDDSITAMNELHRLRDDLSDLMAGPAGEAFGCEFFTNYGKATATVAILPIMLIAGTGILYVTHADSYPQLNLGFYSAVVFFIQCCIPSFLAPHAFFGKWKANFYKEKLEWDAFKSFLSDYAMIEKYVPEDIGIWKDWLVYGTALGVGENVVKAMNQLKIPAIPEVHVASIAHTHFDHAYSRSSQHVTTKSEIAAWQSQATGGSGGGIPLSLWRWRWFWRRWRWRRWRTRRRRWWRQVRLHHIFSGLNFDGLADKVEPHRFVHLLIQAGILLIESFFIL